MHNQKQPGIAYFGSYKPSFFRVRTTLNGLKNSNISVFECNSHKKSKFIRLIDIAWQYLKIFNKTDVMIVSEAGQSYVFLAKILALITGKPLIFDAFISYYHVKTEDEKSVSQKSLKGRYFYWLDKISCSLANIVILDTAEHIDYFSETFGLPKEKFRVVPVGSDEEIFHKKHQDGNHKEFLVLSGSSFYPLHGVEYIIKAAKLIENEPDIKFLLIGDGPTRENIEKLINELKPKNLEFRKGFVSPFEFSELMSKADICLGQFGETAQVQMVVPAKIYDSLAMGKPVITGFSKSVSKILTNRENVIFCNVADEKSLAESILLLKNDDQLRNKIGENGYKIFKENFSTEKIGKILNSVIKESLSK